MLRSRPVPLTLELYISWLAGWLSIVPNHPDERHMIWTIFSWLNWVMFFQVFRVQCFLNQHFFTLHTDVGRVAGAKGSRQFYPKSYELSLNETVLLVDIGRHICSEVFRGYSWLLILITQLYYSCNRAWHDLPVPRYPNFSASMRFRVEQDMVMLGR